MQPSPRLATRKKSSGPPRIGSRTGFPSEGPSRHRDGPFSFRGHLAEQRQELADAVAEEVATFWYLSFHAAQREESVTHVLGTMCYSCVRAGPSISWSRGRDLNSRSADYESKYGKVHPDARKCASAQSGPFSGACDAPSLAQQCVKLH